MTNDHDSNDSPLVQECIMLCFKTIRDLGLLGLTLALFLAAGWSAATEPKPPAGSTDTDDSAEAAQRDEILQGPEWQEAMHAWDAWLAVQRIYNKDQVK